MISFSFSLMFAQANIQQWDAQMGPPVAPQNATQSPFDVGKYAYRILRKGEHPWSLRTPPDTEAMPFRDRRALLVSAIALGNDPEHTSIFLHTSQTVPKVLNVFGERRKLYSHWLVRWPRAIPGVPCADFSLAKDRQRWLAELDGDSDLIVDCLKQCRNYMMKDAELVYFAHPGLHNVEWWDEENCCWQSAKTVPTGFKGQMEGQSSAATSQIETSASAAMASSSSVVFLSWNLCILNPGFASVSFVSPKPLPSYGGTWPTSPLTY